MSEPPYGEGLIAEIEAMVSYGDEYVIVGVSDGKPVVDTEVVVIHRWMYDALMVIAKSHRGRQREQERA